MQRYICDFDLSFQGESAEATRDALQEVYNFAESQGFKILHAELSRAREDKPVEMFCLGSSEIYQNEFAEQGRETATA